MYRIKQWLMNTWASLRAKLAPPPIKPVSIPTESDDFVTKSNPGYFTFRETILDDLAYYFKCVRRMRMNDPDAYDLFKRIGMAIVPEDIGVSVNTLPSWWRFEDPPPFAAVSIVSEATLKDEKCFGRFIYFRRYKKRPARVEPVSYPHNLFLISVFIDSERYKWLKGVTVECFVAVDMLGGIHLLKELHKSFKQVRTRDKNFRTINIPTWGWEYPEKWVAYSYASQDKERKNPQSMAELCLCACASMHHDSNLDIQIRCTKGDTTATFGVATKRTAYFFKDRDLYVNENGNRKRIFHVVRPHERNYKKGSKFIKMHYRGQRDFTWNEYSVHISVPGLHHPSVYDMGNLGALNRADIPRGETVLDAAHTGKEIARTISV